MNETPTALPAGTVPNPALSITNRHGHPEMLGKKKDFVTVEKVNDVLQKVGSSLSIIARNAVKLQEQQAAFSTSTEEEVKVLHDAQQYNGKSIVSITEQLVMQADTLARMAQSLATVAEQVAAQEARSFRGRMRALAAYFTAVPGSMGPGQPPVYTDFDMDEVEALGAEALTPHVTDEKVMRVAGDLEEELCRTCFHQVQVAMQAVHAGVTQFPVPGAPLTVTVCVQCAKIVGKPHVMIVPA